MRAARVSTARRSTRPRPGAAPRRARRAAPAPTGPPAAESRFDARVLDVGRPGLVRPALGVERLDRPAGKQLLELACLVHVARAERRPHSVQRTSRTPSISATPATIAGAVVPCRA